MGRPAKTAIVWDPRFLEYDLGEEHPFQERFRTLALSLMRASGSMDDPSSWLELGDLPIATDASLARFHAPEYLSLVRRRSEEADPPPLDSGDTPAFSGCFEAAARIASGTLRAWDAVVGGVARTAFQPGGGLHHAHPDRASGFCIFNDVAIAIASGVGPGTPVGRVAYLDIDAHHGDGVMYGFYADGRVLDLDFHQDGRTLFPGTGAVHEIGRGDGAGLKVNVPLPPGAGDETVVPIFSRVVPTMLREFRPEMIVLQHGLDAHEGDPLAALRFGPEGYATILAKVRELADELCAGRLVVTGGGGYRPEHVARVLASVGLTLGTDRAPLGPLPEPWRAEFLRETGRPAPVAWRDRPPARSPPREGPAVEGLVWELETALGRKFPRVD